MTDETAGRVEQVLMYQCIQLDRLLAHLAALHALSLPEKEERETLATEVEKATSQTDEMIALLTKSVEIEEAKREIAEVLKRHGKHMKPPER
jgi:hypothetical protein